MNKNVGLVKTFTIGFVAGVSGLALFYYLILFITTKNPWHAVDQFVQFQPWMSFLIAGFGIQIGLYWLMKKGVHFNLSKNKDADFAVGTGTAVSGIAMVACCAHHVIDVLPLIGLSVVAVFFVEYQKELLLFGVISNLAGIAVMTWYLTGKVKLQIIIDSIAKKVKGVV